MTHGRIDLHVEVVVSLVVQVHGRPVAVVVVEVWSVQDGHLLRVVRAADMWQGKNN